MLHWKPIIAQTWAKFLWWLLSWLVTYGRTLHGRLEHVTQLIHLVCFWFTGTKHCTVKDESAGIKQSFDLLNLLVFDLHWNRMYVDYNACRRHHKMIGLFKNFDILYLISKWHVQSIASLYWSRHKQYNTFCFQMGVEIDRFKCQSYFFESLSHMKIE